MPRALPAALLALAALLAALPTPALAVGVLSNGTVAPTSGTTSTSFTFTVDYLSTDSPQRPAQSVWAQVGSTTVPMTKISGSGNDGTWQGSSTLPAGTWSVTFNATTADPDEQPAPLAGPSVTVSTPPTPAPTPTPSPTPRITPTPPPVPPPPPPAGTIPPPQPTATPDSTPRDDDDGSASPSASATATSSGSDRPTASPRDDASSAASPSEHPIDDAGGKSGGFVSLLVVGGTMSLVGAAVLARQWAITRTARPH